MNNNASETQNNANHIKQQSYSVIRISFIQLQRISLEQLQKTQNQTNTNASQSIIRKYIRTKNGVRYLYQ